MHDRHGSRSCSADIIIHGMPAGSCSRHLAVLCHLQDQHKASSTSWCPCWLSNTYVQMPLLQGDLAKLAAGVHSNSTSGQDRPLRGPSKEQLYGGWHGTMDTVSCPCQILICLPVVFCLMQSREATPLTTAIAVVLALRPDTSSCLHSCGQSSQVSAGHP